MDDLDIKNIRISVGKTQQEFADELGVHKNTVQLWEKGTRNISVKKAFLLKGMYPDCFNSDYIDDKKVDIINLTIEDKIDLLFKRLRYLEEKINDTASFKEDIAKNKDQTARNNRKLLEYSLSIQDILRDVVWNSEKIKNLS